MQLQQYNVVCEVINMLLHYPNLAQALASRTFKNTFAAPPAATKPHAAIMVGHNTDRCCPFPIPHSPFPIPHFPHFSADDRCIWEQIVVWQGQFFVRMVCFSVYWLVLWCYVTVGTQQFYLATMVSDE